MEFKANFITGGWTHYFFIEGKYRTFTLFMEDEIMYVYNVSQEYQERLEESGNIENIDFFERSIVKDFCHLKEILETWED